MLRVKQFAGQDDLLLIFVTVKRRNAALGGTVFLILQTGFFQRIQVAVIGQQQGGALRDFQIFRRDGDAGLHDAFHLLPQRFAVQRDAVAQNVYDALAENAGGQQMQTKFPAFVDDGMAGIAAALIADDDVIILCHQVHHAALAFVAPVDSHNCAVRHNQFLQISDQFLVQFPCRQYAAKQHDQYNTFFDISKEEKTNVKYKKYL